MDIASHREIQRIQRPDNEKLAKTSEHAEEQKRKASNEWNGFWSTATKMEKKKEEVVDCCRGKSKKEGNAKSERVPTTLGQA